MLVTTCPAGGGRFCMFRLIEQGWSSDRASGLGAGSLALPGALHAVTLASPRQGDLKLPLPRPLPSPQGPVSRPASWGHQGILFLGS